MVSHPLNCCHQKERNVENCNYFGGIFNWSNIMKKHFMTIQDGTFSGNLGFPYFSFGALKV